MARTRPPPPSAKPNIAKWCANDKDDIRFAIETRTDPPILIGNLGMFGARQKDRGATIAIAPGREPIGRGYDRSGRTADGMTRC